MRNSDFTKTKAGEMSYAGKVIYEDEEGNKTEIPALLITKKTK